MDLEGWELKALRAGRINFGDGYAIVRNNEIFLVGTSIPPLLSASTHVIAEDRLFPNGLAFDGTGAHLYLAQTFATNGLKFSRAFGDPGVEEFPGEDR